jgi:hypothetical protein
LSVTQDINKLMFINDLLQVESEYYETRPD